MGFFSPAPARMVSASADEIGRRFRLIRIRQVSIMLLGYALFYVCRLAFSATKKTMIEEGAYTAREIGYVGSALLVAYAIGKLACGFLADRANIRRMFAFGLFVSSLATMTVGFHVPAAMLMVVWFVNGLAQGSGSPCCVVSLARWWPNRSRGTFYGIWSCSNNLGEAIAYVVTSVIMVKVGEAWGADLAWRSGFWGASLFGFIGVALIAVFMRDSPQSEGLPSVAEWEGEVKGEAERKTAGDVGRGQRLALTNWAVWMVALAGGFFAMSRYAIIDWGIFFLEVKKGYATETAAWIITLNSIVGAVSSGLSGIISDRLFKGSRNELALMAGVLNVTGLSLMMLFPVKCIWLDVLAMVCFGLAVGILLTFLGGLMAVDLVPRVAAGAALGIAGMGNYFGAGIQSAVSGLLVGRDAATGKAYLLGHTFANGYTIDYLSVFWIGMATLSVLCALTVWRARGTHPEPLCGGWADFGIIRAVNTTFQSIARNARKMRVECLHGILPPPPVASKRRVGGLYAAIRRIPEATLAAVVFAALASSAFAHGWIDERAATTGQTGSWSEAVAYDPATQTAELEGDVVFTPKAVSAGNFVTLKFAMTLVRVPEDELPGADAQAALRIGSNGVFQVWTKAGWLDATASGIEPVSGAEYNISFVFDYAAGKYSVSVMDAKGVWQLLQSAAGISAFPIAAKAEKVKDIKIDGETQFRSLEGSFMSFGANHGAWRSRRRTEAPITARGDFVTIRRHHAQKLEVSSLYGGTNHGARRFCYRTEASRAEIGGFASQQ